MPVESPPFPELRRRLDILVEQGAALQGEGLPFPTTQIRDAFEASVRAGSAEEASAVLKRSEALLERARRDWNWVRELLHRVDELRAVAELIGVDVAHLDARVGNPRGRLMSETLSAGALEKAAASASLSLAVLNDALPKFLARDAQTLGLSIRKARDRGEEVARAAASFSRLVQAMQDQNYSTAGARLVEARREVARIPRAPTVASITPAEEEEILMEARTLARRLQKIKSSARDAQSAARLVTQVRAALAEDRRYGSPEEEIEELYQEVARLAREKKLASVGPPIAGRPTPVEPSVPRPVAPASRWVPPPSVSRPDPLPVMPASEGSSKDDEEEVSPRSQPFSYYLPYVPPETTLPTEDSSDPGLSPANRRGRPKSRP
jgi:HAMP domain-containing protein